MQSGTATADDPLMTPPEVAARLGGDITEGTLSHWRNRGGGPDFIKVGHRVRYRQSAVDEWLRNRTTQAGKKAS